MAKIFIDASGAVFGRLCSFAAKKAVEGNEVIVVNSEKAVITGDKNQVIEKYRALRRKGGHSQRGPKVSKTSYRILKRGIRGMLPNHREGFGRECFLRVMCYDNVPKEFEKEKMIKIPGPKRDKFVEIKEISEKI